MYTAGFVQRICEIEGIGMSRQSVMISGAVQGLEDRVHLGDCCIAGVSVGGFAPQGWGELRLEVCVKEPVFPFDSCREVSVANAGTFRSLKALQDPC